MRLGGSLRRTRSGGGGGRKRTPGPTGKGKRSGKGRAASAGAGGWPRLVLGAVGLALLGWGVGYGVSTQIVFPAAPPPADLVEVPDLRGVGVTTAGERLAGAGLALGMVDSIRHPSVSRDVILGQSPLPGQLAFPGTDVRVTRSLGPQMRPVPDVVRVDASRARIILETAGFVVHMDSVDAEIPRGRVVGTRPAAEEVLALPAEIRLRVSRGPPLVPMPLLLGLEEGEAMAVLDSLGLVVGEVEEVFRFGRDQGVVVEQEPPADTPMERGSAVRLAVGRRGG